MLHMRCWRPRALIASCSCISQTQRQQAVAVSYRASSSSSSPSSSASDLTVENKVKRPNKDRRRIRKDGEVRTKPVKKKDVGSILETDFSFFSRWRPRPAETLPRSRPSIVNLCDAAIILSRTSSDPASFTKVRQTMSAAARQFKAKLGQAKSSSEPLPDMSYDVFLVRSSWLQVVRTILALAGKEAEEVCSYTMCDYLIWERSLLDSGLELNDGTEQLPTAQARQQGRDKVQEEKFFYGPFVQDSAVVLYDLFWHLTISEEDAKRRPMYARERRTYSDAGGHKRSIRARKLWRKILGIPVESWSKPMSTSWLPYPYSGTKFKNARRVITTSMLFQGQALIRSQRLSDCIALWKSGIPMCGDGLEAHTTLLMARILVCLRQTQQYLQYRNIPSTYAVSAGEYFKSLYTLLELLVKNRWPEEHNLGSEDGSPNYDTIMHLLLSVDLTRRMVAERDMDSSMEEGIDQYVQKINTSLHSDMAKWSHVPSYGPPSFKLVSTCNNILYRLIMGTSDQPPAPEAAMSFLRLMMEGHSGLPAPDRSTSTKLLQAGKAAGNPKIVSAVLSTLSRGVLRESAVAETMVEEQQGDKENGSEMEVRDLVPSAPSFTSAFLLLVDEAVRQGDTDRLISLLDDPRGSKGQQKQVRAALSPFIDVPVVRLVFFLYPSLNIARRRGGLSQDASNRKSAHTAAVNAAALHPKVLTAVLQLVAQQGKTGLAERVFRLIKRKGRAKELPNRSAGFPIPIKAYTIMMKIYALEVKRGRINSNRSTVIRRSGGVTQRRSSGEVRGWARVRFGPLRNRLPADARLNRGPTARAIVKQEYQELKVLWETGGAEPANNQFWKAVERVFRRDGHWNERLQLGNNSDRAFYKTLMEDIAASSSCSLSFPSV